MIAASVVLSFAEVPAFVLAADFEDAAFELFACALDELLLAAVDDDDDLDEALALDDLAVLDALADEVSLDAADDEAVESELPALEPDELAFDEACESSSCCDAAFVAGVSSLAFTGMMTSVAAAPQASRAHAMAVAIPRVDSADHAVRKPTERTRFHQRRMAPMRMGFSTNRYDTSAKAMTSMICAKRTHQGISTVDVMLAVVKMMG